MKHKHAELIKAWADGAIIQFKNNNGDWMDCAFISPCWKDSIEYRIKPEPKPDLVRYGACNVWFDEYDISYSSKYEGDNLKLTFDGETGKLISAEVL